MMLERNKAIHRVLALSAAVLFVAALLFLVFALRHDIGMMVVTLFSLIFGAGMVALLVPLSMRNPNINKQYQLRRVDGRLRFVRRHYLPDPEGWRYVSYGVMYLLLSLLLLFLAVITFVAHGRQVGEGWVIAGSLVFVVAIVAVIEWGERKIGKQ